MILSAIRFKTVQNLNDFIKRLIPAELMSSETNTNLTLKEQRKNLFGTLYKALRNQLLQTPDGSIYFVDSLQNSLDIKVNKTQTDPQPITATEAAILMQIPLNLFDTSSYPSLNSVEEIQQSWALLNSDYLNRYIERYGAYFDRMEIRNESKFDSIQEIRIGTLIPYAMPTPWFIDLLKITSLQEAKLQQHLIKEMEQRSDKEQKDALKKWIDEIELRRTETQKFFENSINPLKVAQALLDAAHSRRQSIEKRYPLKEVPKQIEALTKEKELAQASLKKEKNHLKDTRRLILGSIGIGPLVLVTLATLIGILTIPAFPFFLVFAPAVVVLGLLIFSFHPSGVNKLSHNIELKYAPNLKTISENITELEGDIKFMQAASEWNEFTLKIGKPQTLISEFESSLGEMKAERAEGKIAANTPVEPMAASSIGFFSKKSNQDENDSNIEPVPPLNLK